MSEYGMDFAAHTITHPRLTELADVKIEAELRESKGLIEEKLKRRVTACCYPYGDYDDRVMEIAKRCGFECACSMDYGVRNTPASLFRLKRLAIGPHTSLAYLKFIFSGFYDINLHRKSLMRK